MSNEKVCTRCGVSKPFEEFSPVKGGRLGLRSRCKPCLSELAMQHRDRNPDVQLNAHLLRKFGITLEQYNALLDEQGGVCAVCETKPVLALGRKTRRHGRAVRPRLVVDHDHTTGEVRGLLCAPCNRGIGFLGDSPGLVRSALTYLEGRP